MPAASKEMLECSTFRSLRLGTSCRLSFRTRLISAQRGAATGSVAQQLLEIIARLVRAKFFLRRGDKDPLGQLEPLAIVGEMFFLHRIRAAVATFVSHGRIVARAIETDFQVRAAIARLRATGRTAVLVFQAALPTMSGRHTHDSILQTYADAPSFHLQDIFTTLAT